MGFDDNRSLGRHEFGATTALPIWAAYMEGRLAGAPETSFPTPPQLARLNDDWTYAENADGTHGIAALGFPPPAAAPDAPADVGPSAAPTAAAPTPAALEVSPQASPQVSPQRPAASGL
jgi:penicillin-binding protein 1A